MNPRPAIAKLPAELSSVLFRCQITLFTALLLSSLAGLSGCGSGGVTGSGGGGGTTAPSADFSLSLSTASLTLAAGSSQIEIVSITPANGFSGTATIQWSGIPSGVTVTPATAQIAAGATVQFSFTASATAVAGSYTATVTGASGTLSHSQPLVLTIPASAAISKLGRTKFVRTDATTNYASGLNSGWVTFHPETKRFFVSDPDANLIHVMDATSETQIATITVPGAFGLDVTPDHGSIYAGTQIGDVYVIDPVSMKVVRHYLAAHIGPIGYQAFSVKVLANGWLVLLGGQAGKVNTNGYYTFAVWKPESNELSMYTTGYGAGLYSYLPYPVTNICPASGNIGAFILSGNRTRVVFESIFSDKTLCSFDPVTGARASATGVDMFGSALAATPDGVSILQSQYGGGRVVVFDAKTLLQKSSFSVASDTSATACMLISSDSRTLYIGGSGRIYAYDITSGALTGWTPTPLVGSATPPPVQALDSSGLLAGPMREGVGFIDVTAFRTGAIGSNFTNATLSQVTGPVGGGTTAQWSTYSRGTSSISSIFFGPNQATNASRDSVGFHATSPAGTAGTIDVYSYVADGGAQILPEAFSYGPTLLQSTTDRSTAEGGGVGYVYGYGLGSVGATTIPAGLQVTVGGRAVTVTAFTGSVYQVSNPSFPLQALAFTIPAGIAGTDVDITVTTASGTASMPRALHYIPAVTQFPLTNASLGQGIYDRKRDLFYFTDTNTIRVFSRTTKSWLPSLSVPAAAAGTSHRLWAMGLSPDGSRLAVSDPPTHTIYVLDPTGFSPATSFTMSGKENEPAGVAISDKGIVYFGQAVPGTFGATALVKLDTTTGKFTEYPLIGSSSASDTDLLFHIAISDDGQRVYFNDVGQMLFIDTTSDKVVYGTTGQGCCYGDYDLHLANNQTALEATNYLYDGDENGLAYLTLNLREALNVEYLYGTAFSPDGALMFQPSKNGIDVFDGRLGTLRTRIALPVALAQNYDALVAGGPDNLLVAITGRTGTGIALVDLTSLAEPEPLPYLLPAALGKRWANSWNITPILLSQHPASQGSEQLPARAVPHVSNLQAR